MRSLIDCRAGVVADSGIAKSFFGIERTTLDVDTSCLAVILTLADFLPSDLVELCFWKCWGSCIQIL